jgi:spoIIIJ-associated protein
VSQGEDAVGGVDEAAAAVDTIEVEAGAPAVAVTAAAAGDVSAAGAAGNVGDDAADGRDAADRLGSDEAAGDQAAEDEIAVEAVGVEAVGDQAASVEASGDEAAGDEAADEAAADEAAELADLEFEGEVAADYIEGLLDVADLDGDIDMDVEGDRAMVSVVGATLEELVGARGEVLEALQELTRLAVHRQTGMRTRIMLDVGGYRQRRRLELAAAGQDAAEEVRRTGVPKKLWAMNPFERKVVHDAVAAAGLRSESEGEEPDRRVVVLPAS